MITIQQINEFRERAKAMGKSDVEINNFINQKLQGQEQTPFSPRPQTTDNSTFTSIQQQPSNQKKSVGGFVGNVFKSGGDLIKNTAQAVVHPVETVKSVSKVGLGAAEKVIPGRQGAENEFDQLTNFYKQRYGSFDKLKETVYNDPVGFAADVATLANGVGAVGKLGKVAEIGKFGKVAEAAGEVNRFADPLQAATNVPKAIVPKSFLSKTAEKIYQSALKPSTTLSDAERSSLILTGLKEKIPVNRAGLAKLTREIDGINDEIGKVIAKGKAAGDVVSTDKITSYLEQLKDRAGKTINGRARLADIEEIEQSFLSQYGKTIPTDVAQEIKKNTYQVLRKSYGEMKAVAIESEKTLARGIKEQLAEKYPQLKYLNAQDSALIQLEKQLERAAGRIANRDVVGLGTTVASTANPLAGAVKAIIDNPTVKSKLAIALQQAAERVPKKARIRRVLTKTTRLTQPARESKEER